MNTHAKHLTSSAAPLLYSREQARRLLGGISVSTMIRLEAAGRLRPIKLSRGRTASVYYSAANIRDLALLTEPHEVDAEEPPTPQHERTVSKVRVRPQRSR